MTHALVGCLHEVTGGLSGKPQKHEIKTGEQGNLFPSSPVHSLLGLQPHEKQRASVRLPAR